jgi:periplasmic protein TonB
MAIMSGASHEAAPVASKPDDDLFATVLAAAEAPRRTRWQRIGVRASVVAHVVVVALLVFVPIFTPPDLPDHRDYIRALLYDPPPPPPPPLPKGSSLRPQQAKPETPKPVVEKPPEKEFTAPIETPPVQTAKLEPEQGVRPQDQFGSETGSELGDALGMEGGTEGGVVGGVPGGVLGGVLGGTGTGPVMDYDSPPRPVKMTKPVYPQEAFIKKIEGTVLLEILIDSQGRVVRARVIQSVPLLDAAALQCVYQWVFQPAVKNGRPVPTIAHAPVNFRIY